MFSRKSFDNKKHPFRTKGTRSPKPYKKERVGDVLKQMDVDIYTDTTKTEKR
jgi:hypothetical protein